MKQYMTAKEVSEVMGVSISGAYKVIRELNSELKANGYITASGKVPTAYFKEKSYGFQVEEGA